MKFFIKLIAFIILLLNFNSTALADIAVLNNSTNSLKIREILNSQKQENILINAQELNKINVNSTPIIIINSYHFIDNTIYSYLINYTQKGGKLILITPTSLEEFATFQKLSKLVGVNVEKFAPINNNTDVNWVEKTVTNNTLLTGTYIANVSLYPETSHLAVFGDIEKHESAISLNPKGSVISWSMGIRGEKSFNEKSLKYLLIELQPKSFSKPSFLHPLFDYNEELEKLKTTREKITNYQDNIINYSKKLSLAQENIELSKINELLAIHHYKKNDYKDFQKYINLAQNNVYNGAIGTDDLAVAENRGIWFDRGTIVEIKNQNQMSEYFEKLKKAGINTVYFETLNAGYTIYPSTIATQTPLIKGKDPLAWAVEEAHKQGIKIHAWLWIFAVGNDRHNKIINKADNYVGPILEKNERWALLGENANFRPKNQPEFWIDPSNKEATNFLLAITREILQKYNVDGIQLDYIRYPFQNSDNLMGFNHNSMERFSANTGEKLFHNNFQYNFLWNKWKEGNVTSFVRKIDNLTQETNPNLKISASIFAKSQTNRLSSIQQNWENWLINSYIDYLTPMSYSMSLDALNTNLFYLRPQSTSALIYPGIALKHVDEMALLEQISYIREAGYPGITFFAVAQLEPEKINFLNKTLYAQKTYDPTYNTLQSAIYTLEEHKKTLETLKNTTYDLTSEQKNLLDKMLTNTNNAIFFANNSQINLAIDFVNKLEKQNEEFFKLKPYLNKTRKQTANSYIKRALNLLKISLKR